MVLLMDPMTQITIEHIRCTGDHKLLSMFPPELAQAIADNPTRWGSSKGSAIHLRRTRPRLKDTIQRSLQMFPQVDPGARWLSSENMWIFSSGYRYTFAHCADPDDWTNHTSIEYSHIAFDELVEFLEQQYEGIRSRLRSDDPILGARRFNTQQFRLMKVRSMSNPVLRRKVGDDFTIDNPMWVRDRFVKEATQGRKTLFREMVTSKGDKARHTMIYLPARLQDNPNKEFVANYELQLLSMPLHMRKALMDGDWWVTEHSYLSDVWNPRLHVVKPFRIPPHWPKFRTGDWGFKKPGCVHWFAMDDDGDLICFREFTFQGKTAEEAALQIIEIETGMGLARKGRSLITGPMDSQLWEERGDGGKSKAQTMLDNGVPWELATKTRRSNAMRISARLRDHDAGGNRKPGLVFFENCTMAIRTLPSIQSEPGDPETPQDGGEDHWWDSVGYGVSYASVVHPGSIKDEADEDEVARPSRGALGYG